MADGARLCASCSSPVPATSSRCPSCGSAGEPPGPAANHAPPRAVESWPPAVVAVPELDEYLRASTRRSGVPWTWQAAHRAVALAVAAASVAALTAALVVRSGGDEGAGAAAAGGDREIFLEPSSSPGREPFTDAADPGAGPVAPTTAPAIPTPAPPAPDAAAPVRSVPGAWPGLYGGTRASASCDPAPLVAFLHASPERARAWAGALDLAIPDLAAYVDALTPVVLQRDTRVTSNGFRNGEAVPTQSVLQAGTAVLVDTHGVPRVKCNGGNPLLEPVLLAAGPPAYRGMRWRAFSPANLVAVAADVEVPTFVLVDVAGGAPFGRPPGTLGEEDTELPVDDLCDLYPGYPACGGGEDASTERSAEPALGTGDVQVTLRWFSTADLDLSVIDPSGEMTNFSRPASTNGGTLDADSNRGCASPTGSPVENIYWPAGTALDGEYVVTVSYFTACGGGDGPQAFELTFVVAGQDVTVTPEDAVEGEEASSRLTLRSDVRRSTVVARDGQLVTGTVAAPGATVTYRATRGPGAVPPTSEAPVGESVDPDCSAYAEGSVLRLLCEHDPTTGAVTAGG